MGARGSRLLEGCTLVMRGTGTSKEVRAWAEGWRERRYLQYDVAARCRAGSGDFDHHWGAAFILSKHEVCSKILSYKLMNMLKDIDWVTGKAIKTNPVGETQHLPDD